MQGYSGVAGAKVQRCRVIRRSTTHVCLQRGTYHTPLPALQLLHRAFSAAMLLRMRCWASLNAHGDLFILTSCRGHVKCFMEMPSCNSDLPERGLISCSDATSLQEVSACSWISSSCKVAPGRALIFRNLVQKWEKLYLGRGAWKSNPDPNSCFPLQPLASPFICP